MLNNPGINLPDSLHYRSLNESWVKYFHKSVMKYLKPRLAYVCIGKFHFLVRIGDLVPCQRASFGSKISILMKCPLMLQVCD